MDWPLCDKCGGAVTTGEGVIAIGNADLLGAMESWRAWEKVHGEIVSLDELLAGPEPVRWQWGHDRCISSEDSYTEDSYTIDPGRFDSLGKALDQTLHMMEKTWLQYTDWISFVRRVHHVPNG
jgi:hypothetical protein